ncbi:MAG: hypothetical protein LBM16_00775 [Clostridiales bacterium]|nr:hypothetical protein [Clostridiales bacterium]
MQTEGDCECAVIFCLQKEGIPKGRSVPDGTRFEREAGQLLLWSGVLGLKVPKVLSFKEQDSKTAGRCPAPHFFLLKEERNKEDNFCRRKVTVNVQSYSVCKKRGFQRGEVCPKAHVLSAKLDDCSFGQGFWG